VDQVKRGALGLADESGNLLHTIENIISNHLSRSVWIQVYPYS
jgi:hypothetical protein